MAKRYENDPKQIFQIAETFLKASKILSDDIIDTVEANGNGLRLLPAFIANHALACELYFKCLKAIETSSQTGSHIGTHLGSHNLWDLFQDLDKENGQHGITHLYEWLWSWRENRQQLQIQGLILPPSIEEVIKESSLAFVEYWYFFDKGNKFTKSYSLEKVVNATRLFITSVYPEYDEL